MKYGRLFLSKSEQMAEKICHFFHDNSGPVSGVTENTIPLSMWVVWFHMFHCSGTVHLVPHHVATLLPAALLLLRDFTANVTCSSVTYAAFVMLISFLLCHNLVTALYMLQCTHIWWNEFLCFPAEISNLPGAFNDELNLPLSFSWIRMK
jgi:hypothetical protein